MARLLIEFLPAGLGREMPRMNGFRMLDELGEYDFDIIFTTAYTHYVVDAI